MFNTKWEAARRAWKIQTRRRRLLQVGLRHLRRFIRRLVHPISTPTPLLPHYAERQFSFNSTPIFQLKLHRRPPPYRTATTAWFHLPRFLCLNPKVEFDYEFESYVVDVDGGACDYEEEEEEDGIDLKAEKFIKMFYEEMKMQSQVSYLQFDEFSNGDE